MRRLFLALLWAPLAAWSAAVGYRLDRAPIDPNDLVSLQSGAQLFVNYCLNCHGAQYMRYNRLTAIGLSEAQIRDNLIFTGDKVGDTMRVAMTPKDGKAWFGVAPPDLSLVGRARGADWLYTYLRTFYRDPKSATGWNNAVFPNVAMPHALWLLQGERALEIVQVKDRAGRETPEYRWRELSPGALSPSQYDAAVRDLVNFLMYVAEPQARTRRTVGIVVLFALGVLFVLAYALKKEYWKDVK
ncbi:MAG: cytochrome c1 [Burkholderiales bacterium]|nr:cytochrome c1 [Burkholderiales bacterium]